MPIEITMPRLSDTMESGTIIKWHVAVGDEVSAGEVLADVETDKATMEMQAFDDGRVASISVPEGQQVEIGTVIAVLAEDDESIDDATSGSGGGGEPVDPAPAPMVDSPACEAAESAKIQPSQQEHQPVTSHGHLKVTPVARRIAESAGIDVATVSGTGPGGRITKKDVQRVIETTGETAAAVPSPPVAQPPSSPVDAKTDQMPVVQQAQTPQPPVTDAVVALGELSDHQVPVSNMRQTIARRLIEAKTTIPHYQVTMSFDMEPLLEMRRTLNEQLKPLGVKLSVNDFVVRCCGLGMSRHPEFNASWGGETIDYHGQVNVGIAISLPPQRGGGLVVATIRDADKKSLRAISAESKAMAAKARDRGLTIEEMSDSTFTVSNLGMFGVEHFTAIINPPNSAILAVGAAIQQPVVKDGQLAVGTRMEATLSLDHRVIDGAMAAQYLETLKELMENPAAVLV